MPSDWVELAKEGLKLATRPRYSFSIWLSSLILLAMSFPDFLHLDQFRNDHGHFIGIAWLFFFILWCVEICLLFASDRIKTYFDNRKKLAQLDSLTYYEAQLLTKAAEKKCQSFSCGINLDQPYSLMAKGLLERVCTDGKSVPDRHSALFTIPRFVWDHILDAQALSKLKAIPKVD